MCVRMCVCMCVCLDGTVVVGTIIRIFTWVLGTHVTVGTKNLSPQLLYLKTLQIRWQCSYNLFSQKKFFCPKNFYVRVICVKYTLSGDIVYSCQLPVGTRVSLWGHHLHILHNFKPMIGNMIPISLLTFFKSPFHSLCTSLLYYG